MFRHLNILLIICLTFLTGCKNYTENDQWVFMQHGYSYKITKTGLPEDDVFHLVKATAISNNDKVIISNDSIENYFQVYLSDKSITAWKNSLPKGIKGQLKIDVVAVVKEMLANTPVRMMLPESYDFSHLHADTTWLLQQPFCKTLQYISKEEARKEFLQAGGSDYKEFLDYSLMPTSIDFYIPPSYIEKKEMVESSLKSHFKNLEELVFPSVTDSLLATTNAILLLDFKK